jgi:hypothetical protein
MAELLWKRDVEAPQPPPAGGAQEHVKSLTLQFSGRVLSCFALNTPRLRGSGAVNYPFGTAHQRPASCWLIGVQPPVIQLPARRLPTHRPPADIQPVKIKAGFNARFDPLTVDSTCSYFVT